MSFNIGACRADSRRNETKKTVIDKNVVMHFSVVRRMVGQKKKKRVLFLIIKMLCSA